MSIHTPEYYRETLEDLKTKYSISFNELINIMPEYNTNPNSKTIQTTYSIDDSNFKQAKGYIDFFKRILINDSTVLQKKIDKINSELKISSTNHDLLEKKYNALINTDSGAKGMLFDSQLLYNQQYIGNLVITCVIFFTIKSIYTKYY